MRRLALLLAPLALLVQPAVTPAAHAAPYPGRLKHVYDAGQLVVVTNRSWTATYATLQTFERRADGSWRRVHGPWGVRIGRHGFGSPKREGDGQTPVGSFRVPRLFGVNASPGTKYPWLRVDGYDVWVDDPRSAYYNTRQRRPADGRWSSAEALYQPGPYAYAAVVGYNSDRTPYEGSAIFFHVTTGRATAGCVSATADRVRAVLRWLDPARKPRFVLGPESAVTA